MNQIVEASARLARIARYAAGENRIDGRTDILKLSSNENPFGPGLAARRALQQSLDSLERYPSQDHAGLRDAIAGVHGLEPDRIVCGAGSDEVLRLLCLAFAGPGTEVIHTRHGFLMYPILARSVGAVPVEVAETGRRVDVDKVLGAISEKTRIIFIANPNNPTGTMLDGGELARLAAGIPASALLVLDGAYVEYAGGYDGGAALASMRENVIMTRTFSKIHGLAALRIGYGYGSPMVIDALDRIREPFNVSGPAQAAAAAAVQDMDHVRTCQLENSRNRRLLASELAAAGVPSDRSFANFILARFADPSAAAAADGHLRAAGIVVRRMDAYQLPDCLRITVGDGGACRLVSRAIAEFMDGRTEAS